MTGADELIDRMKIIAQMDAAKKIVKTNTSEMSRAMARNASFHGHFEWEAKKGLVFVKPTGTTKRSIPIGTGMSDGGFTGFGGPLTEYAYYVEFGTRFMAAQPFVGPAFNTQSPKFKADLERLVE
jgi:HK97 gp10 family phage protein